MDDNTTVRGIMKRSVISKEHVVVIMEFPDWVQVKKIYQAAFRLYPIMHWTESYAQFSRHFVKSFKKLFSSVGHNDDDLVRPLLDSKFCSLLCFFNSS